MGNDWLAQTLANHGVTYMAKRSKAKAKRAKTAKTKKAKTARKATKSNKKRKLAKTMRAEASGTDPCAAQQQAFEDAASHVEDLKNQIGDPDLPPEVRKKAQKDLGPATVKMNTAQRALDQCREQNP